MKRFLFPALFILALFFVWRHLGDARELENALRGAAWAPLFLALGLQMGTLFNQPAFFASLYRLVKIPVRTHELMPVVWAGRFLNVVAPAAGLGETVLLYDQARRRGWSLTRLGVVTTLYFALNFAVFALILVAGLLLLGVRGELRAFELWAAFGLWLALAGALFCVWRVRQNPRKLASWAARIGARMPRLLQKRFQSSQWSASALEFGESLRELPPWNALWTRVGVHAVLVDALEIAVLAVCLYAFGVTPTPTILVASYAVGTLFTVVSISPQGLGAVEGALGAVLVSLGVPLERAMAIVVCYRGLSFWLPLAIGFAATRFWSRQLQDSHDLQNFPVADSSVTFGTGLSDASGFLRASGAAPAACQLHGHARHTSPDESVPPDTAGS